MHKSANELKERDCFLMAGDGYEVMAIFETADEERIKIAFSPITGTRRHFLIIDKDVMFTTL